MSLYGLPNGHCVSFLERFDKLLDFLSGPVRDSYEIVVGSDVSSNFDTTDNNIRSVKKKMY